MLLIITLNGEIVLLHYKCLTPLWKNVLLKFAVMLKTYIRLSIPPLHSEHLAKLFTVSKKQTWTNLNKDKFQLNYTDNI